MGWWRKSVEERKQRAVPEQYELRLDQLEADVEQLREQFRTLRGYVYVKKGLVGPPGEPPPGEIAPPGHKIIAPNGGTQTTLSETREEFRARMVREGRLTPGRGPGTT